MITFDLSCDREHRFEGWFRNSEDFEDQLERNLLTCPLCGSNQVTKRLSAVALHVGRRSAPQPVPAPEQAQGVQAVPGGAPKSEVSADSFLRVMAQFIERNFADVGPMFAEEARKIERGESEARNIRGTTTPQEEDSLRDEGIEFLKVALPKYDA